MTCFGSGWLWSKDFVEVNGVRYLVKTTLGEGGFSYVDLVQHYSTRKLYALKRIKCHSQEDEKVAIKEVEYMRSFKHENLVPCEASQLVAIRGYTSVVSELFIVMPYYRKGSIHDELQILRKTGAHLSEQKVLELFRGVCEGIKALHTMLPEPLVHRDIKPHNVMLTENDTPVLLDFGSMGPARVEVKTSSQAAQLTDMAAERCSMPYRAPELFHVKTHSKLDEKVDIWSLGCLLYAMCFYESPFDAVYQRGDSIALAVMSGVQIPTTDKYSTGLLNLMSSLLQVSPHERPTVQFVIEHTQALLNTLDNRV